MADEMSRLVDDTLKNHVVGYMAGEEDVTRHQGNLITSAVQDILGAVGEDTDRDGLKGTPGRVARMYLNELCSGYKQDPIAILQSATFETTSNEMVMVQDIQFYSLCEHHMMPFFGKIHIAYIPSNNKVVGLSKLARVVEVFARRLQIQETMGDQLAHAIMEGCNAAGVMIIIEAEHMCMTMRGIQKPGTITKTSHRMGLFRDNPTLKEEFLNILRT